MGKTDNTTKQKEGLDKKITAAAKSPASDNRGDDDFTLRNLAEMIEASKKEMLVEIRANEVRMEDLLTKEIGGIHKDMAGLKHRLELIEKKPFDPERTVVISGLKPVTSADDRSVVESILNRIGLSTVSIINVRRMNFRGRGPGLLKVELENEEQKIELLRAKMRFNDLEPDCWIRSSQSHAERLNDVNMKTLLTIIPGGEKWKVTANGRLEEKDESAQFRMQGGFNRQGRGRGRGARGGPRGGGHGQEHGRAYEERHEGRNREAAFERERERKDQQAREKRERSITGDTPERQRPGAPNHLNHSSPIIEDQGAVGGIDPIF